jgi:hypothetical protein
MRGLGESRRVVLQHRPDPRRCAGGAQGACGDLEGEERKWFGRLIRRLLRRV